MAKEGNRSSTMKKRTTVTVLQPQGVNQGKRCLLFSLLERKGCRMATLLILLTIITILSTVNLVMCAIFLGSFKMHLFTMASNNFLASPVLMMVSSTASIGFSVFCIMLIFKKKSSVYKYFGLTCILMFLIQLTAVILAFLLRNSIHTDLNKVNVHKELSLAASSNSSMETWNILQTRYQCCGGRGNSGYREWENHVDSYPDSCCTVQYPDCGLQAKRTLESDYTQTIYARIHVKGCITAVKESMQTYVVPLLLGWGVIGLLVCIGLLILLFLCSLYYKLVEKGGRSVANTGYMETEPLKYTSTLNVHLKH